MVFENILLLLLVSGIPNLFVIYDAANIVGTSGVDANIVMRVSIYLGVAVYVLLVFVKSPRVNRCVFNACLFPFLFYFGYLLQVLLAQSGRDLLVSSYRLIEYAIFIAFLLVYNKRNGGVRFSTLCIFFEFFSKYLLFLVLIGIVFFSERFLGVIELDGTYLRLGGTVIHPNTLGSLSAIFILYYGIVSKSKFRFLYVGVFAFVLLMTYSRGALLALIAGYVVSYLFCSKNKSIFLAAVLVGLIPASIFVFDILINVLARGQGVEGFINLSGRWVVWQSSLDIIFQNLRNIVLGISFGEPSEMVGDVMEYDYGISYWKSHNAHNDFLQAWLGGGVVYLIVTLYVYYKIIKGVLKINEYDLKLFFLSVLVVLVTFSISMTSINYYLNPFAGLLWLLFVSVELNTSVKKTDG